MRGACLRGNKFAARPAAGGWAQATQRPAAARASSWRVVSRGLNMGVRGCPWFYRGKYHAHRPAGFGEPLVTEHHHHGIGATKVASVIVKDLRTAVATAMGKVREDVAGETAALVDEIKYGGSASRRELQAQAMAVRAAFGNVVGKIKLIELSLRHQHDRPGQSR